MTVRNPIYRLIRLSFKHAPMLSSTLVGVVFIAGFLIGALWR